MTTNLEDITRRLKIVKDSIGGAAEDVSRLDIRQLKVMEEMLDKCIDDIQKIKIRDAA